MKQYGTLGKYLGQKYSLYCLYAYYWERNEYFISVIN